MYSCIRVILLLSSRYFGNLFTDEPLPENGFIVLDPTKPGFGVTLNRDALDMQRPHAHTPMTRAETTAHKVASSVDQTEWIDKVKTCYKDARVEGDKNC